jgi:hypothetical protein
MKKLFLTTILLVCASFAQITVPVPTGDHPHIFMNQADVDLMVSRVNSQQQPWYDGWLNLETVVEAEYTQQPNPYTGLDASTFYTRCNADSERALRLAIAYCIDGKQQYALNSLNNLYQWAEQTAATVSDVYTVSDDGIYNINTSMLLARSTIQFIFVYDLLHDHFDTFNFTPAMQQKVKDWYVLIAQRMYEGINVWHDNDYFNNQEYQNHLVAHTMGLIGIGYLLEDQAMLQFAIDSPDNPKDMVELYEGAIFIAGDAPCPRELPFDPPSTQTGEIYDRYRHFTAPNKGLQYAHLTLLLLSVCSEMTTNNGLDFFEYTAPTGENLELAFDFYSSFYWLKDARVRGGMYASENDRLALAGDTRALFELGHRYYPDNRKINDVLAASNRTNVDQVKSDGRLWLMGVPVLTHGEPLLPEPARIDLGQWQMEQTITVDSEGKQKAAIGDSLGSGNNIILGRTEEYGGDQSDFLPHLTAFNGGSGLTFDGNDNAFAENFCENYHDVYIGFDISFDNILLQQTILYTTSLFELRMVPNVDQTAACIQFIIYSDQAPVEIASTPYCIVPGNVYHVNAWRKNEIAGVFVDGETDTYGHSPYELTTGDTNLYLASIWKFDRRFFNGTLDNLQISYDRYQLVCGDWGYLPTDVNNDCYVDIKDFAALATQWLECTNELFAECNPVN